MRKSTLLKTILLGGTAVTLAACGGGGGGSASVAPLVIPLSSQFGAGFSTDYMASANSVPVVPVAGDIIANPVADDPAVAASLACIRFKVASPFWERRHRTCERGWKAISDTKRLPSRRES